MLRWSLRIIICWAAVGSFGNLSTASAQAVAPSQITPQSLRPESDIAERPAAGAPHGAPLVGDSSLTVLIGRVRVEGSFPELAGATARLISELQGQRHTVAHLNAAIEILEQSYVQAGYPLVRVVLPQQELINRSELRIQVIDGFIEAVDVFGLPQRVRNLVEKHVASLIGRRHLKQAQIERLLLIAGSVPGLKLRSTLARGHQDGGTRLILDGDHKLLSGSIGSDNRLASSLGTWQLRSTVTLNDGLGFGEQIYGTAVTGTNFVASSNDHSPVQIFGIGAVIPIGIDGLTVNPEYIHSVTRTDQVAHAPASLGTFERFALRFRDPIVFTRAGSLYVDGSLEAIDQRMDVPDFGTLLNHDHYQVLRFGPDYIASFYWGANLQLSGLVSVGLGGRSAVDADASGVPLSRFGATPDFIKVTTSAHLTQPLPMGLRLDLIAAGQYTGGKSMLLPEQITLDGNEALTAFASGTFTADQGMTLRSELSRPFAVQMAANEFSLSPYLFAALGRGWIADATALEQTAFNAGAVGVGVRTSWNATNYSSGIILAVEVARGFTDLAGARSGWRSNVAASLLF
jgi:hemolysin activation/secretion protein